MLSSDYAAFSASTRQLSFGSNLVFFNNLKRMRLQSKSNAKHRKRRGESEGLKNILQLIRHNNYVGPRHIHRDVVHVKIIQLLVGEGA